MSDYRINIPDAPAHLRTLLYRLASESNLVVSQHLYVPIADQWFGGDWGPYETVEDGIVAGVKWLRLLYDDTVDERDQLLRENRELKVALQSLQSRGAA